MSDVTNDDMPGPEYFSWVTERIIAYESSGLEAQEMEELFQALVDTGMAWSLQGHYGRAAHEFLEADVILPAEEGGPQRIAERTAALRQARSPSRDSVWTPVQPPLTPVRKILVRYRRESMYEAWLEVPDGMSDETVMQEFAADAREGTEQDISEDYGELQILAVA